MSIAIAFDVDGVQHLSLGLDSMRRNLGQTRGLLRRFGAEVETQTKDRIQTKKRSPGGIPWQPWSPAYAATRHANHSLLINRGHLQNSIAWRLAGDTVRIGSPLSYARKHQLGEGVPARPFLDVELYDPDDRDRLETILANWVREQLEVN